MTKKCCKCKKHLATINFCKNSTRKDGLHVLCNDCASVRRKERYAKYKIEEKARVRLRVQEQQSWFNKYKQTLKCSECPESRWYVLDFHHKDKAEKEYNISQMPNDGFSKEKIIAEIEKCKVLCSNCHRALHYIEKYGTLV